MLRSESINELAAALAHAQADICGAKKDSANPFFKSKYADLSSVWEACREPLTKNGLSIVQFPITEENKVGVESMLIHKSGQWMSEKFLLTPTKGDPQAAGSAITYARRYALAAITSVYAEDDDSNLASGKVVVKTETNGKDRTSVDSYVGSAAQKQLLGHVFKDAEVEDVKIMRQIEAEIIKKQVPLSHLRSAVKDLIEGRLI